MKVSPKCELWSVILSATVSVPLWGATDEAVHVEYPIRTPIPRRYLKLAPSRSEYYVSVLGYDRNPGTRDAPACNIERFIDIVRPGDICQCGRELTVKPHVSLDVTKVSLRSTRL